VRLNLSSESYPLNPLKKIIRDSFPKTYRRMQMWKRPDDYVVWSQGYREKPQYNQDGLATAHNCDFLKDALFLESYRLGEETGSWAGSQPVYRAYVAAWAAQRASRLAGDFVECGVNRGALSRMIVNYVKFDKLPKTFYLLDTYQGFAEQTLSDFEKQRHAHSARYPDCYEAVVKTFAPFSNVKIVRGIVPDTLNKIPSTQIAYLSVDMNCAAPELAAVEYFWDRIVPGGMIVLDDYGFNLHDEQKQGHDALGKKLGYTILAMPTGQGLIVK
jgi:O-methyltransferase